ncbi:MAG: hypothetical protein JST68_20420 [Bacteroidetes bacterium]|nr:hypothetical protein [Bacteroidota bacterium]
MKYCLYLLSLLAFTGCTEHQPFYKKFDADSLKSVRQTEVFQLVSVRKDPWKEHDRQDVVVWVADSLTVYAIKETRYPRKENWQDSSVIFLEKSTDGGKSWSRPMRLTGVDAYRGPRHFYVSEKYLYCLDHQSISYIDLSTGKTVKIDNFFDPETSSISHPSFDRRSGILSVPTDGGTFIRIHDTTEERTVTCNHQLLEELSIDYRNDTLFHLHESSDRYIRVVRHRLRSGMKQTNLINDTVFTTRQESKYTFRPESKLVVFGNAYVISYREPSLGSDFKRIYQVSYDYGKHWEQWKILDEQIRDDLAEFIKSYRDSLTIAFTHNPATFISQNDFSTYAYVTDSVLLSDKIHKAEWQHQTDQILVYGYDTVHHTCEMFYPVRMGFDKVCKPVDYEVIEKPGRMIVRVRLSQKPGPVNRINAKLYASTTYNYNRSHGNLLNLTNTYVFKPVDSSGTVWEMEFPVKEIDLLEGQSYRLILDYYDNTYHEQYALPAKVYTPITWAEAHPQAFKIIMAGGIILAVYFLLLLVYFIRPFLIYRLYTATPFLRNLAGRWGGLDKVFYLIDSLTFTPLLVRSNRVADAWVRRNMAIKDYYWESEETVKTHEEKSYVPLPVRIQSENGEEIEKPSPANLSRLFQGDRVCIQIVGPGGIGKTTLALQMGRWVSDPVNAGYFKSHIWLPLLIQEETTDILITIRNKIQSIAGKAPDEAFVRHLLKRRRIIVIIDALSERSSAMQDHVRSIYGTLPVNALLISTRARIKMGIPGMLHLYPRPIDSENVYQFLNRALLKSGKPLFADEIIRAEIFRKVLTVFDIEGRKIPVSPIIISLLTRKILQLGLEDGVDAATLLPAIPASIPDVFTDYLIRVNPKTGTNLISDETMLLFAGLVAECSVGENYIPSDADLNNLVFPRIQQALGMGREEIQRVVDRLVANGILQKPVYANTVFVRFDLDPLAECLSAIVKARSSGKDGMKWVQLYGDVSAHGAAGYLQMLEIVQDTYAERLGWCQRPGK